MTARTEANAELVTELAREMLERIVSVAPQYGSARRIFRLQARAYLADPKATLGGSGRKDDPLAFGLTGIEPLLVPALMAAASDVVAHFAVNGLSRGAAASSAGLRWLLGRTPADAPTEATAPADGGDLTPAQWAQVHDIVDSVLQRHAGMTPEMAAQFAAVVVGEGIVGQADRP